MVFGPAVLPFVALQLVPILAVVAEFLADRWPHLCEGPSGVAQECLDRPVVANLSTLEGVLP